MGINLISIHRLKMRMMMNRFNWLLNIKMLLICKIRGLIKRRGQRMMKRIWMLLLIFMMKLPNSSIRLLRDS